MMTLKSIWLLSANIVIRRCYRMYLTDKDATIRIKIGWFKSLQTFDVKYVYCPKYNWYDVFYVRQGVETFVSHLSVDNANGSYVNYWIQMCYHDGQVYLSVNSRVFVMGSSCYARILSDAKVEEISK